MDKTHRKDKPGDRTDTRITKKGSDPQKNNSVLAALSVQERQAIVECVDAGKWEETLQREAQICSLMATHQLQQAIQNGSIRPEFLSRISQDAFSQAQSLKGQPSSLSASLHVSLDGKDLSRKDLIDMLKPKQSNPKSNNSKR